MKSVLFFIFFAISLSVSEKTSLKICMTGDIMLGSNFPVSLLPPDSGKQLFKHVKSIFKKSNVVFGNLEGVIADWGVCTKSVSDSDSTIFAFRMPTYLGKRLAEAGFNLLSIANNHANDFGPVGRFSTKKILDSLGISYAGDRGEVAVLQINKLKVGMLAFSTSDLSWNINNFPQCQKQIEFWADSFNILIGSFHGGAEGQSALNVPHKLEMFMGEKRGNVEAFAHGMIDAGADLVIGHGPHVPRAVEIYKDRFIAYSMGNFCTYGSFNLNGPNGYAPIIEVTLDSQGTFISGIIHSFKQKPPGGPIKDKDCQAAYLIRELSNQDFPETCPLIDQNFKIIKQPSSENKDTALVPLSNDTLKH